MRAIMLDWDGTLADSVDALFEANAAVMAHFGLAFDRDIYRRHFDHDWRLMYGRLGIPETRIDEAGGLWRRVFDAGVPSALMPGAAEALARLSEAGYRLALVTAGERDLVAPQLERLDVGRFLPIRVFADEVERKKPDPAPLRRALELLGQAADPSSAAYLGDTADDMRMARAAAVHGVGVASGLATYDELLSAGADEAVPSVLDWAASFLEGRAWPAQQATVRATMGATGAVGERIDAVGERIDAVGERLDARDRIDAGAQTDAGDRTDTGNRTDVGADTRRPA